MKNSWLLLAVAFLSLNSCQKDQKQSLTSSTSQQSVPFTIHSPREALAAMPRLVLSLNAKNSSVASNSQKITAAADSIDAYSAFLDGPAGPAENYPSPCSDQPSANIYVGNNISLSVFPGPGFADPTYSFQISTDGVHWRGAPKDGTNNWTLPYDDSRPYPGTLPTSTPVPCESIVKTVTSVDEGLFIRGRIIDGSSETITISNAVRIHLCPPDTI